MVRNNESITDIIDECELIVSVIYKGGLTMTEKYRKKPVEVEVIKFDRDKWIKEESQANETYPMVVASIGSGFKTIPVIETLEGDMKVSDGDYIIKGVRGEFYPCKPDIFELTYEKAIDHQPTFVVGEYYWGGNVIYKVLEIEEYVDTNDIQLKVLSLNDGTTHEDTMYMEYPFDDDKPATAEQITTFKRAEHFASKGRKLDEFEVFDFVKVIRTKTVFRVKDVYERDNVKYVGDHDASLEFPVSECVIYSTAEELRGVEND